MLLYPHLTTAIFSDIYLISVFHYRTIANFGDLWLSSMIK